MNQRTRWTIYGVLFGLLFPLVALGVDYLVIHHETAAVGELIATDPLHWIIMLAPIVNGMIGFLIGSGRQKLVESLARLKEIEASQEVEIADVRGELQLIFDHIEKGICTIDRSYAIGQDYNASIERLFGPGDYAGRDIFRSIFATLTDQQGKELRDTLEVAFTVTTSSDDTISSLLPVKEFTYVFNADGVVEHRRIATRLVRIREGGAVVRLMFIFEDITLAARLREQEEQLEREMADQYDRIRQIFSNDRENAATFFEDFKQGLADLADHLRDLEQENVNRVTIDEALAIVHSIKGEAFSLGFTSTAEAAKALEVLLKTARDHALGLDAHLEIIGAYERLNHEHAAFDKILTKLEGFFSGHGKVTVEILAEQIREAMEVFQKYGYDQNTLEDLLEDALGPEDRSLAGMGKLLTLVCQRSAQEERKLVALDFSSEVDSLPATIVQELKDSLLHLVRNSVAHGIEAPAARTAANKPETGRVEIRLWEEDGRLMGSYTDDGSGFDLAGIRRKAVELGIVTAEAASGLDSRETIKLAFREGLSTSGGHGQVAGLGMGMSIVRQMIMERLKGSLSVSNRPGKGVSFRFSIPLAEPVEAH